MGERWKLLGHLMVKDWRSIQWWALPCWLAPAVGWLLVLHPDPSEEMRTALGGLVLFLPGLVVAHMFLRDSPLDVDAFWLTRPVPRLLQLASKAAVAVLWIGVPWSIVMAGPLAFRGLGLTPALMALILAGLILLVCVSAATLALGALLTRHLVTGSVAAMAVYTAMGAALGFVDRLWPADELPFSPLALQLSVRWSWMAILMPIVLYLLYHTRRLRLAIGVLAAGVVLVLAWQRPWKQIVGGAVAPAAPAVPNPQPSWPGMSAELVPGSMMLYDLPDGQVSVYMKMEVKGLPAGYSLLEAEYEVTGRTTAAASEQQRRHLHPFDHEGIYTNWGAWVRWPAEVTLGCTLFGKDDTGGVEVFRMSDRSSSVLAVEGNMTFWIVRPFVAARHSLAADSQVEGRGYRLDIDAGSGGRSPLIRVEGVQPPFIRPPRPLRNAWFHDPESRTCLPTEGRSLLNLGPPPLWVENFTPAKNWANQEGLTDYTWARELVVLSGDVVGSVTLPFRYRADEPPARTSGL